MSVALLLHGRNLCCAQLSRLVLAGVTERLFAFESRTYCLRLRVSLCKALAIVHTTGIEWQR